MNPFIELLAIGLKVTINTYIFFPDGLSALKGCQALGQPSKFCTDDAEH